LPASVRLLLAALAAVLSLAERESTAAEAQILHLHEGTGIAVSASPGGAAVFTDLAGRLWRIEPAGGAAVALTAEGEFAQRPAVSPDGQHLAYQSLRGGFFQIIQMPTAGGPARQLTQGNHHHLAPAWSSEGKKLLLSANRTGDFGLWELDLELLTLSQITFEPGDELDPAWAPTGKTIAYVADDGPRSGLYLREPLKPARLLASGSRLRAPAWRPDGSVITFVADRRDGSRLNMVILSDPPLVKQLSGIEDAFPFPAAWIDRQRFLYTADGRIRQREFGALAPPTELAFTATVSVMPAPTPSRRTELAPHRPASPRGLRGVAVLPGGHLIVAALGNLWEINRGGELIRQLTDDPFADGEPTVSADGERLVFVSDRDGTAQLWLMHLGTGESRQLTHEPVSANRPAWDAAGERLAYLAAQPDGRPLVDLKVLDPKSGVIHLLAAGLPAAISPAWAPDGAGVAVLRGTRLAIHAADGSGRARHLTLLEEAVGAGDGQLQWSADGQSVAVASSAGINVLPMVDAGVIGAEWRTLSTSPASLVRWADKDRSMVLTGPNGLYRLSVDGVLPQEPVALHLPVPAPTSGVRLIIRASQVFTGLDSAYLYAQDIVIENSRITEIRPWSAVPEPGARLLDVRGRTVMPGLIDVGLRLETPVGERIGRSLLAYGITTVQARALDGSELREAAERWQTYGTGPRLFTQLNLCGPGATPTDLEGVTGLWFCPALADDPAQGAVQAASATGMSLWTDHWLPLIHGRTNAVAPGFHGDTRWSPAPSHSTLYQDAIEAIVRSGAQLVPGLAVRGLPVLINSGDGRWLAHRQYPALLSNSERLRLERMRTESTAAVSAQLRAGQRAVGQVLAGGGHVAIASRSPATPYGLGFHAELALLARAGIAPAQVLQLTTAEAARVLGLQADLGSIQKGRLADLLVIDGDPLADVTQLLHLETVVQNGEPRALAELLAGHKALKNFTAAGEARR
jgi:Tol biopolymer transport system component